MTFCEVIKLTLVGIGNSSIVKKLPDFCKRLIDDLAKSHAAIFNSFW